MNETENLARWKDAGQPHIWVWSRSGVWCDQELDDLLVTLRFGPYWPMAENDIRTTLDEAAETYHDLERWHLLGDDGQRRSGDEIWF